MVFNATPLTVSIWQSIKLKIAYFIKNGQLALYELNTFHGNNTLITDYYDFQDD